MAVCLVIDDEALHREIDCFARTLAGYDTCEAATAEDALTISPLLWFARPMG